MIKKGYIYAAISPSGKYYIGQTIRTVKRRWNDHKHDKRGILKHAIKKYGFKNFKVDTLIICNVDKLNYYEKLFIKSYNSLAPNGYNCTSGGDSEYTFSEETRRKIGLASKEDNKQKNIG